jgi:arylsulfatase A-like enzyme
VGEVDYFTHKRAGVVDWQRNGTFIDEKGYVLTLDGDEAVKLIDKQPKDRPFFLYFASLAPHAPYQAQKSDEDRYVSTIKDPTRRTYAAMITSLDDQVGRIVAELDKRGMRENTLIIFPVITAGPAMPWLPAARIPRRNAKLAASSRRRCQQTTAICEVAKAVCMKAAFACQPSLTGPPSSSRAS